MTSYICTIPWAIFCFTILLLTTSIAQQVPEDKSSRQQDGSTYLRKANLTSSMSVDNEKMRDAKLSEEKQLTELTDFPSNVNVEKRNNVADKDDTSSKGRGRNSKSGRKSSRRRSGNRRSGRRRNKSGKQRDREPQGDSDRYGQVRSGFTSSQALKLSLSGSSNLENEVSIHANGSMKIMPTNCNDLKCDFGGKCIKDELRAGVKCQCPLGTQGLTCSAGVTIRHPKFDGTGYMAFPVLRDAYKEFVITIEFRPDTNNGLMVYSGEYPTAMTDFISITLVNGHAELRFDCGTGMARLTTTNTINLRQWNTIVAYRNEWDGWLQLNDGQQARGRSQGLYSRITFREELYIGGYRNLSLAAERVGTRWGMIGCIRNLEVNEKVYDMRKGSFVGDAIFGVNVGECSANTCDEVRCMNGGHCAPDSADSAICLCPLGTSGPRCETRGDVNVPSLDGNSYLQYIGLQRRVLSHTEIEITFKPTDPEGLLLYNGYSTDGTGDFISIALNGGIVEFKFDLGTGPAVIRNDKELIMGEWHTVRVSRTGRTGYLYVDDEAAKEGTSQGAFTQLTLTLDMFVGGHRNFDEIAKKAGITHSFSGCIQKVSINDKALDLIGESMGGVNIGNCPHPCANNPCINGGLCIPMNDLYKCNCPLGFESKNCENHAPTSFQLPSFAGNSYLKFSDDQVSKRISGEKFDMQITFRTNYSDGLIFWTAKASNEYLAIGMKEGFVQFSYNLGSGEVIIPYTEHRLNDGVWHHVRAQRYGRMGYLEIDHSDIVEGTSPGIHTSLESRKPAYLGGIEDIYIKTFHKFDRGFSGCIANVTLDTDYQLDLIEASDEGWNVKECKLS